MDYALIAEENKMESLFFYDSENNSYGFVLSNFRYCKFTTVDDGYWDTMGEQTLFEMLHDDESPFKFGPPYSFPEIVWEVFKREVGPYSDAFRGANL